MAVRFIPPAISHSVAALSGPPLGGASIAKTFHANDTQDGGTFKVQGTVAIDATPDIPVKRKVRLFCLQSGRLVRETWSDPVTGGYLFDYIRQGPWLVVSHDYANSYNAVVADNILGEPM